MSGIGDFPACAPQAIFLTAVSCFTVDYTSEHKLTCVFGVLVYARAPRAARRRSSAAIQRRAAARRPSPAASHDRHAHDRIYIRTRAPGATVAPHQRSCQLEGLAVRPASACKVTDPASGRGSRIQSDVTLLHADPWLHSGSKVHTAGAPRG